jgi:phage-related protein
MAWIVDTWGKAVDREIEDFGPDLKARLARFRTLIESYGPDALRMPHARPLKKRLWELRLGGHNQIGRIIYMSMAGQRVVILRAFVKKTQKTPAHEIELAWDRAKRLMT